MSSALLTPTDLSPSGRSFDVKLHSPYENGHPVLPYVNHPSLIFESNSPIKGQERLTPSFPPSRQPLIHFNHTRQTPHTNAMPFFEPFAEPPTPAPGAIQNHHAHTSPSDIANSIYSSPPARRHEHSRVPAMDWRLNQQGLANANQTQSALTTDWRHASDKQGLGFNLSAGQAQEEPLRTSYAQQQPPASQSFQNAHEVSFFPFNPPTALLMYAPQTANQFLILASSIFFSSLSRFRRTHHQVVRPTSLDIFTAKAQSRRCRRERENR